MEEEKLNYNKLVMQEAWKCYKIRKNKKCYEKWTFAESLYWAHRTIKHFVRNKKLKNKCYGTHKN